MSPRRARKAAGEGGGGAEVYFPGFHGATRGQGFLWSPPPQLFRWRATKRLSPFSDILRIHGFLPGSFYFLPWLLLAEASWLPRADGDSRGGGGVGWVPEAGSRSL